MIHPGTLPFVLAMLVLGVGIYAVSCKKNLVKVIVGVMVAEHAVNLFLLLMTYRATEGGPAAPILTAGENAQAFAQRAADPTPQALILTSIVIGLGIVALMVAMALRLHEKYGTFDLSKIRSLRG
jgi:multicomponent Na+:H+ antiporter subunit C